jgi:hypothetical protein
MGTAQLTAVEVVKRAQALSESRKAAAAKEPAETKPAASEQRFTLKEAFDIFIKAAEGVVADQRKMAEEAAAGKAPIDQMKELLKLALEVQAEPETKKP